MFPLLFQTVIFVLDYSFGTKGDDKGTQENSLEKAYETILDQQGVVIGLLNRYKRRECEFRDVYESINSLNEGPSNKLIIEYEKETKAESDTWSIAKVFRTILSITMLLSLIRMAF